MLKLLIGQGLLEDGETGIGDGETAVELAARNVCVDGLPRREKLVLRGHGEPIVLQYLAEPFQSIFGKVVLLCMVKHSLAQRGEDRLEGSSGRQR